MSGVGGLIDLADSFGFDGRSCDRREVCERTRSDRFLYFVICQFWRLGFIYDFVSDQFYLGLIDLV